VPAIGTRLPFQIPSLTSPLSKLARLRAQLLEPGPGAGAGPGTGFDVSKSGDARIALVGFPSVGKSTFLSKITKTKSEVAAYSFTTLTAIPGVLEYGGAEIQILDLPGIIEGASEGKGRGRQVISAAKVGLLLLASVMEGETLQTLIPG
jgi:ribosome-interacting GTPase 1